MNNTTKNIVTILGVLTVAFGGYYFYVQTSSTDPALSDAATSEMLNNTQVFIAHSQELDRMRFDLSVLENERFRNTRAFTAPVESQPIGRTNPFAEVGTQ